MIKSSQGCLMFHRSWKPSHAQFEKLSKNFTDFFFLTNIPLFKILYIIFFFPFLQSNFFPPPLCRLFFPFSPFFSPSCLFPLEKLPEMSLLHPPPTGDMELNTPVSYFSQRSNFCYIFFYFFRCLFHLFGKVSLIYFILAKKQKKRKKRKFS